MFSKNRDVAVRRNPRRPHREPRWIHLPIAEARRFWLAELPMYCEALRHQGKRQTATAFHAVVDVPGEPDRVWIACAECTSLMMDDVDASVA